MSTEFEQTLVEGESTSSTEVTATPEIVQPSPEVTNDHKEPRVFTQDELNEAISKRLAREQRKWEREQSQRQVEKPVVPVTPPSADQFETTEAYADALALRKAEELIAQREAHKQRAQIDETYAEREEDARAKYDDFEQVAYNKSLRITDEMAEVIKSSDIGPDLAYWLGSNPKEADRIARMSPLSQAREIGKIEVKLTTNPPQKKTTSAPAPITPVNARVSNSGVIDTTDPRSTKTMTTSEWIAAERQRQIAKLKAQQQN